MNIKQAVKFTFDTRFDAKEPSSPTHVQEAPAFTQEDLDRARSEGHSEGFSAGIYEAENRAESEIDNAMRAFSANAASLLSALQAESAVLRGEAVEFAMTAARKLAPAMIATRPQAEIEAVLRDCLTHLNREPHIVLRVADILIDRLKVIVDRMALERGLSGRIILLGHGDMAEGDCIVEWTDGGVVRSRADTENEMNDIVARYVETLGITCVDDDLPAMPDAREQTIPGA